MKKKNTKTIQAAIFSILLAASTGDATARDFGASVPIATTAISLLPGTVRLAFTLLETETREIFASLMRDTTPITKHEPQEVVAARPVVPGTSRSDELSTGTIPNTNGKAAVFDTVSFSMRKLGALAKFAPSLDQIRANTAFTCRNARCSRSAKAISETIGRNKTASLRDKLNIINSTVNEAIRYQRDHETYGVADRWAKPSETMTRGAGDCEDFAILKMAALHAMGVPADSMALVVVFDQRRKVYHAVLAVAAADRYFILDNVRNAVLGDRQIRDYMPLYSIVDGRGFFHGIKKKASGQIAKLQPFELVAPGEGPEGTGL